MFSVTSPDKNDNNELLQLLDEEEHRNLEYSGEVCYITVRTGRDGNKLV